jgi:polyphosphate kinase 2
MLLTNDTLMQRIHRELLDHSDEELELELLEDGHDLDALFDEYVDDGSEKEARRRYFSELFRLQGELVKLQSWVVKTGHKVVILFEGRDAAGKGGVIKRITQRLNPRVCRVAALPAPNDRERTQWYFQRYVSHLPAAGEIVLFDRSWYNRAGVEKVMGFCNDDQYEEFFRTVPEFERMLARSGIQLIKYWFSISDQNRTCAFSAAFTTRSSNGSSAPWTWSPVGAGRPTPRPRKSCWNAPTSTKRHGGWCKPMTRRKPDSIASTTCSGKCLMKKWSCQ